MGSEPPSSEPPSSEPPSTEPPSTKPPRIKPPRMRSPIRGPWLTSVFASVLLIGLPIVIVTGLLSYIAYGPQFGQSIPGNVGYLHLPFFDWPSNPSWLYRLTQGLHVGLGFILVPLILAKIWSVIPKLFIFPPVKSVAQALERLSLIALVGGVLFETATGILNTQYDYIFGFSFYTGHYWGAWVFIGGFVAHVVIKLPIMIKSLRSRSFREVLRTRLAATVPEPMDETGLVAPDPDPPTVSRRGALALVGGGALFVGLLTIGQTTGGFLRNAAILVPRGRSYGDGPNAFQINRTSQIAQIDPAATGDAWRLTLKGGTGEIAYSRAQLLAMPQTTVDLPLACVEGWSTVQTWTGVRLRDLFAASGVTSLKSATVSSLERNGPFTIVQLQWNQVLNPNSLLALKVNGADLSLDHGFPARIIAPALPGVHCTKWVESIEFRSA